MDSMQLPLVAGLVALLILLLVVRAASRRRARRAAEADAMVVQDTVVVADQDADQDADQPEAWTEADAAEAVAADDEVVDTPADEHSDGVDLPEEPEEPEAPAAPVRRRRFGRRRRGAAAAFAVPVVDPVGEPAPDVELDAALAPELDPTLDSSLDSSLDASLDARLEPAPGDGYSVLDSMLQAPGADHEALPEPVADAEVPLEAEPAPVEAIHLETSEIEAEAPAEADEPSVAEPPAEPVAAPVVEEWQPEAAVEPQEQPVEQQEQLVEQEEQLVEEPLLEDAVLGAESLESVQPVPAKRRGWFGWRRRRGAVAAVPVAEPAVDPDGVMAGDGDPVAESSPAEVAETAEVAEPEEAGTPEQAEIKALREQLRALELVVQQQSADHPTAALAEVEETVAEQSAAYLRQVALVVSGLAAHTSDDENPRRTLARVAAAVERLGVPNSMERPILPVSHELPSRAHDDGSHHPSHLLDPHETGGDDEARASTQIADVFAGLDALAAPPHPAPPASGVAEPLLPPLLPPLVQPAQEPVQEPVQPLLGGYPEPPVEPASEATVTMPAYGQHTGGLPDLSALAAYDNSDYDGGYDTAAEGGIPAFEEPPAVLPVPPPAAPEPARRRRGRKSKSR